MVIPAKIPKREPYKNAFQMSSLLKYFFIVLYILLLVFLYRLTN